MFLQHLPENLIQSFFDLAYTLIATDGIIHKKEKDDLAACAEELNLSEVPKCTIVDYEEELVKFDCLTNTVKRELYFEMLMLVYSDASYSDREKHLLDIMAEQFGISRTDSLALETIAKSQKKDEKKLEAILCVD